MSVRQWRRVFFQVCGESVNIRNLKFVSEPSETSASILNGACWQIWDSLGEDDSINCLYFSANHSRSPMICGESCCSYYWAGCFYRAQTGITGEERGHETNSYTVILYQWKSSPAVMEKLSNWSNSSNQTVEKEKNKEQWDINEILSDIYLLLLLLFMLIILLYHSPYIVLLDCHSLWNLCLFIPVICY